VLNIHNSPRIGIEAHKKTIILEELAEKDYYNT
jgi:hypothetical protein